MPSETRTKQTKPKKRKNIVPKRVSLERGLLSSALSLDDADGVRAFEEWAIHLNDRKHSGNLRKTLKVPVSAAVGWLVPEDCLASLQMAAILSTKPTKTKSHHTRIAGLITDKAAEQWLMSLETRESGVGAGLDGLAWCHALPSAAAQLSRELWVRILDSLCELATQGFSDPTCSWAKQVLHVELPLALAWQFPEVERCERLAPRAADLLSANVVNLLDGQGMIRGSDRQRIGEITACWTRCLAMLMEIPGVTASRAARTEFDWLLQCVLRLVRSDGQLAFSKHSVENKSERKAQRRIATQLKQVVEAGLRMASHDPDVALSKLLVAGKKVPKKRLLDEPSFHSEWSGIAILRSDWRPKSANLTVDFSKQAMTVELQSRSKLLFSTEWCSEILVDGIRLEAEPNEEWDSVCWFSDEMTDYLELEMELKDGWRIQRQFLLGRSDEFLLACDNIIRSEGSSLSCQNSTGEESRLEYRLNLPLPLAVNAIGNADSREGVLRTKKKSAVVIPVSLPEWRSESRFGEFHLRDNEVELCQRGQGSGLNACLFFDLNAERFGAPLTWRQLTVADTRRIVSRDEAVGYRIQIGASQWLAYRSLVGPGNRTLLGHNFSSDFLFARLSMDGHADPLVEVE